MKIGDVRWLRWMSAIDADMTRPSLDPVGPVGGGNGRGGSSASGVETAATETHLSVADLTNRIGATAFAFRGYDVANLGRSRELLAHERYGPVVREVLDHFGSIASEALGEPIDLVRHIEEEDKTVLAKFALDVASIVAMEYAQLRLLEEFFAVPIHNARLSFGYSIGELTALLFSGVYTVEQLLPIPLGLARDSAELAEDTTLGVLFTRGPTLPTKDVERLCRAVSSEGHGLIGPSAFLSPNTALLLGQHGTLDRIEALKAHFLPEKTMLRRNPNQWPPLHSPLVWRKLIPNRVAVVLYSREGGTRKPSPPVISCVTGSASYDEQNSRDILTDWTDHPQRLWDVIDESLSAGVEVVVHVGPAPSLIAATFARLANNVSRQMGNSYLQRLGRGLVSEMNRHAWLARILPSKSALLRLPFLVHVMLEDWLLEQPLPQPEATSIIMAQPIGNGSTAEAAEAIHVQEAGAGAEAAAPTS